MSLTRIQWGSPLAASAAGTSAWANGDTPLDYFIESALTAPGTFPDISKVMEAYKRLADLKKPLRFSPADFVAPEPTQEDTPSLSDPQSLYDYTLRTKAAAARAELEAMGIPTAGMSDIEVLQKAKEVFEDFTSKAIEKLFPSYGDLFKKIGIGLLALILVGVGVWAIAGD